MKVISLKEFRDEALSREFSRRLRNAMAARNMSQAGLALKANIYRMSISHYCSGEVMPRSDTLLALATALSVSPNWLLGVEGDANDPPLKIGNYLPPSQN